MTAYEVIAQVILWALFALMVAMVWDHEPRSERYARTLREIERLEKANAVLDREIQS